MQSKKKIYLYFLVVIIFLIAGYFLINQETHLTPSPLSLTRRGVGERSGDIKFIQIGGQKVQVALALTSAEQTKGLSGRTGLAENQGMLFVFDTPGKYLFWMKDMRFPIDMIWLGADFKIVYLKKNASPQLYPETYGPGLKDGEAKYVLEVPAGFSAKNNLQVGESVQFTY